MQMYINIVMLNSLVTCTCVAGAIGWHIHWNIVISGRSSKFKALPYLSELIRLRLFLDKQNSCKQKEENEWKLNIHVSVGTSTIQL
jgi:hypothetical protein